VSDFSRRRFLHAAALAAGAPLLAAKRRPTLDLDTFPYGAVELLESPFRRQFDENHWFFLGLSEDRLLKIYRQRAGLPAPGEDMGGWYDDFCPGASFGQYVSALARFAAATGSSQTAAKVRRLVQGYAQTIASTDRFFVGLRYPGYTYDKLVCGLLDAHSYAADPAALPALYATTKAARPHMADRALTLEEAHARPHLDETYTWDETYTLAENLFLAYALTGDRLFFDMAHPYLLDRTFFNPLSGGVDVLPGLHAYSHVNALSSGIQGYLQLGDAKYFTAVQNAVEFIWQDQSFATGGWGPNEAFVEPGKGLLGASLSATHRSFETPCGAYAHCKLMRYLLRLTRDARYGDSMERILYNTVLGALPILEDGSSFYYSDYHHSAWKTRRRDIPGARYRWDHDGRWPCCSGTLPQVAADYAIDGYFQSADGVYVNLYLPSRLTWTRGSVRCVLRQETGYPLADQITIHVEGPAPADFAIHLRIPGWAGPHTRISVNGKRVPEPVRPGGFFAVQRTWRNGDRVELELDQPVRTQAVDARNPDQVAVMRGPLVLFAVRDRQPELRRAELGKLQLTAGAGGWSAECGETKALARPFYLIQDEIYQTYWRVLG
jgi:uncharacterized protein